MMIAENISRLVTRRIAMLAILLVCVLVAMAEDVTFMNNRRQWEKLPSKTLMYKGFDFYERKSMPDSALLCFHILANRLQTQDLQGKELEYCIKAISNLGIVYSHPYYELSKSYDYLLQAEELAIKHNLEKLLPRVYVCLVDFYVFESQINASQPHDNLIWSTCRQAFTIGITYKEWNSVVPSFIDMAERALVEQKLDSITDEISVFSKLDIPDSIDGRQYAQKLCEGVQLWQNNKKEEALRFFNEMGDGENWNESSPMTQSVKVIKHVILYAAYHQMGQNALAIKQIRESEHLANEYGFPDGIMAAYQNYIQYYTDLGDKTHADFYRLKRYEFKDSIIKASHVNDINTVRFLREIDKMNEEVKGLTYKEKTKQRVLWIVVAFLLIALVLIVLLYLSRRRIQEGYQRLYRQNVELLAADEARRQAEVARLEAISEVPKYSHNQMDDDVMDELWLQIKRVMETSEDIYHDPFGVDQLADLLGAKRNYVSQTINTKTGEPFPTLLTEYRIREACRRMNDQEHYGNYSVEGIAQSVGYGSRSHFAKLFKAATGVPPSAYMKMCKAGTPPGATTPS
jgi:YesN/AraC family two-component response regulator